MLTIQSFTAALSLLLLTSQPVAAQQPAPQAASPVYFGASFSLQSNTAAAAPCAPPGNRGIFCGDLAGITPGAFAMLGVFITHRFALEVGGSLAQSRVGTASYDGYSHTDSDITTATYEHSDRSMSSLLRIRVGGTDGPSFEPVIGAIIIQATDSLTQQSRVIKTPGYPSLTRSRPDASTSRSAAGFLIGVDIVSPSTHGVSLVASVRIRWVDWPERTDSSYYPTTPQEVVPSAVGRQALIVGAGIRWGGRRP